MRPNQHSNSTESTSSTRTAAVPEHFRCSLSLQLILDPVTAPDGHTYERHHISHWLTQNRNSPLSRERFSASDSIRIMSQPSSIFFKQSREAFLSASPEQRESYLKDTFTPFCEWSFNKLSKDQRKLYFESLRVKCIEDTLFNEFENEVQEGFITDLSVEYGQAVLLKHLAERKPSLIEADDQETHFNLVHIAIQYKQPSALLVLAQYAPHLIDQVFTIPVNHDTMIIQRTSTELAIVFESLECLSVLKKLNKLSKISNRVAVDILRQANNELLKILISNNRESFINNLIHSSGITVTHLLTTYPNPLKLNIVRIKKILTLIQEHAPGALTNSDHNGLTPLHYTLLPANKQCLSQKLSLIRHLLSLNPGLIMHTDKFNNNLAHMALNFDSKGLMLLLQEYHTDLFSKPNTHGLTPIDMSAYHYEPSMMQFLLQLVPQHFTLIQDKQWTMLGLKIINYNNRFPKHFDVILEQYCIKESSNLLLKYAIQNQRVYLLRSIIKIEKKRLSKNTSTKTQKDILLSVNHRGHTLLHQACAWGQLSVIRILEKKCPELFSHTHLLHDKLGLTPMHLSCIYHKEHVLRYMHIKHKKLLYLCDKKGNTLAHIAAQHNHVEVMKVLQHFSYGIIHVLNHKKESPYQIAKQQKHKKMILHLLNARKTFHRSVFFLQPPIHRLHDEYSADSITPVTQNFLGLTQL